MFVAQLMLFLTQSFGNPESVPSLEDSSLPFIQPSQDDSWLIGAMGSFLEELLASSDPAVVLEAGRSLIEVRQLPQGTVTVHED